MYPLGDYFIPAMLAHKYINQEQKESGVNMESIIDNIGGAILLSDYTEEQKAEIIGEIEAGIYAPDAT